MSVSNFGVAVAQFTSASTAGVVRVLFGFVPDFAIIIQNHGGTNPNIRIWVNNTKFSQWADALSLLLTGSTGVVTRVTSGVEQYAGGTQISSAETTNSDPKHVDRAGTAHSGDGTLTQEGLEIAAALQTNSGANIVIAVRSDN